MKRGLFVAFSALTACGLAVSPSERDAVVMDRVASDHYPGDIATAIDSAATVDAGFDADADASLDAHDAALLDLAFIDSWRGEVLADSSARDAAYTDIVRTYPDRPECLPTGDGIRQCQEYFGLSVSDPGARFSCCWGQCASGDCAPLEAGLLPNCGPTPCDLHAGQLCCRRPANVGVCVPRDRGLCQY